MVLVDTSVLGIGECNEIVSQLRYLAEKSELRPDIAPKLLNQKEVADILGLSLSNFKKLEKEGTFTFDRKMLASSVRYRSTDVFNFIHASNE